MRVLNPNFKPALFFQGEGYKEGAYDLKAIQPIPENCRDIRGLMDLIIWKLKLNTNESTEIIDRNIITIEGGARISASPVISKDGTIYIGDKEGNLFSIYLKDLENAPKYDGTVYDEENDHWVRNDIADILDKSAKSWRVHTRTGAWINTVIVGKDGTIFVGDSEGYVLRLSPEWTA